MSYVEDLKHEAFRLARAANDLAFHIDGYRRETEDTLQDSLDVLDSSSSGIDTRVAASLRATAGSLKTTVRLLQEIGDEAASYARRV